MNVGQLYEAVLTRLNRKNDPYARDFLPTWRELAEGDIFNTLRAGWLSRRGDAVFTKDLETLPPSIIQIQGMLLLNDNVPEKDLVHLIARDGTPLSIGGGAQLLASGSPRDAGVNEASIRPLNPVSPNNVNARMLVEGTPTHYSIEGQRIRILPWPNNPIRVNVSYYSKGDPLIELTDTNETLSRYPSVYLYGMLRHAAIQYGDQEGQERWQNAIIAAVTSANAMSYDWQGTGFQASVG